MTAEELKKHFGDEYPSAVFIRDVRLPLKRETRFSRNYYSADDKMGSQVSRFMDGSASITLAELEREWPSWCREERSDFCGACTWLHEQPDFRDMLRLIMRDSGPDEWSAVALDIACNVPCDEAFEFLCRALHATKIGGTSNISQAIAKTKHASAEAILRNHLQLIWTNASLWDDDRFLNWVAFDAATCIAHLIELDAPPSDFEEQVRALSRHACSGNRDSCRDFLAKHYSWLQSSGTS